MAEVQSDDRAVVHPIESARLRPRHRLVSNSDFKRVRNEGRSWPHPLLVMYVRNRPARRGAAGEGTPAATRFGIVVSKHVGNAVVRNRVKRRLREILRHRLGRLRPQVDMVLIARNRSGAASFAELEAAVDHLARRAGLYRQ